MDVQDTVGWHGIVDKYRGKLDPEVFNVLVEIVRANERFRLNLMDQLRKQPQLVNADPSDDPDAVRGVEGLAYYQDGDDVSLEILGG